VVVGGAVTLLGDDVKPELPQILKVGVEGLPVSSNIHGGQLGNDLLQRQRMLVVGLLAEYADEVKHLHLALSHGEPSKLCCALIKISTSITYENGKIQSPELVRENNWTCTEKWQNGLYFVKQI